MILLIDIRWYWGISGYRQCESSTACAFREYRQDAYPGASGRKLARAS